MIVDFKDISRSYHTLSWVMDTLHGMRLALSQPPCPPWPDTLVLVHLVGLQSMDMSSPRGGRSTPRLSTCVRVFAAYFESHCFILLIVSADLSESCPLCIESDHTPFCSFHTYSVVLCGLVPRDHGGGSGLDAAGTSSCAKADCGNAREPMRLLHPRYCAGTI